ncbi:MAG: T9SS type A sorting domain-containing protein, partial [Vicingaceae bacterium]|nr:T9SS type A sorting domain-containing protein [Vicingaceae bacterium]
PNLVYMVLRYNKDVYAWDSPWEYCQSVLTTDDFCYLTTKSFIDSVHCFTERKYRVYAVDTLNQVTSCYSNEINVDILTNISELEKNKDSEILVYPNPNNGIFNIALPTIKDEVQVTIYNLSGQQIEYLTLKDKGIIDISKQPNGIYFVKVIHQHQVITKKIIKY